MEFIYKYLRTKPFEFKVYHHLTKEVGIRETVN